MINQQLDASSFIENCSIIYNNEFEKILATIITCYRLLITSKVVLPNNENLIRDEIVNNYLMNNKVRMDLNINNYLFIRENPTKDNTGRVDIYVATQYTFQDTDAYYVIECKRLNATNQHGITGFNAKYISEGIARFASEKYTFYDNSAGMIGFIVEKMDMHQNVSAINILLSHFPEINSEEELTFKTIVSDFKYSYFSKHKIDGISKVIYHLMLDFSDNIAV
jgi:hypothetical protein